ncbi:MAG TPA: acetyl-coenzyme A synthetase, partial [Rhodobiaceae bacterium]|nr:acetyl-coenzyme A synthetase [Rhodobiaceae bacterium]
MSEDQIFAVPKAIADNALVNDAQYQEMYQASLDDPDAFWAEHGQRLDWMRPYTKVKNTHYGKDDVSIKWYEDGTLNACVNCVDRHLADKGDQTAIIWEGDEPDQDAKITYQELHDEVCRFANVLKAQGVKKGDRVTIYMPMIPEASYAMLACARIGAVHSVVFGGFSPDALAGRILDCDSTCVITADEGVRGGKKIPLKANTDAALAQCPDVTSVIVVERTGAGVAMQDGRDVWYHAEKAKTDADCPAEEMNAEDPLFILYTSGSTGKPKGV